MSSRWLRYTTLTALLAFTPAATGCFGSFAMTRKIHSWNQGVSGNKFVQWLVFLGLTIIPVYGVGVFIDAWILNSIEFWTDSNPMASNGIAAGEEKIVRLSPDTQMKLQKLDSRGTVRMEVMTEGKESLVRVFVPQENGMDVLDAEGAFIASARSDSMGGVSITDASGTLVARHDAQAAQKLMDTFEQGGAAAVASQVRSQVQLSQAVCLAE